MVEEILTKRQRDGLYLAIERARLKPANFHLGLWAGDSVGFNSSNIVAGVKYGPDSRHSFAIREDSQEGIYSWVMRPGRESRREEGEGALWSHVLEMYEHWLEAVKYEVSAPDLWSELRAGRPVSPVDRIDDNTPFTAPEQRYLAGQIDNVLESVLATPELSGTQAAQIREDLGYLKEALRRSGRRDWVLLVLGTVVNQAITYALPAETVNAIWHKMVPILQSISHLASKLLQP